MPYMDQRFQNNQEKNIQILQQFLQFQFPKKPIHILLSISAFSILFSLFHLISVFSDCIPTLSLQIISYTTDRNYIFLFCNAILALLIKNSSSYTNQDRVEKVFDYQKSVPEVDQKTQLAREDVVEFRGENENFFVAGGKESEILNSQDEIEEKEEEEEEGEEMELMSAEEVEEFNKKCEEFIRKMKRGIKLEAQNRVIMV